MNHRQAIPAGKIIAGLRGPFLVPASLGEKQRSKIMNQSILWGSLNFCMLVIFLYDLSNTCPIYVSYVQYIEYVCVVIFTLNIIYHIVRYIKVNITPRQVPTVPWQKKTDAVSKHGVKSLTDSGVSPNISLSNSDSSKLLSATPMNMTATSWTTNNLTFRANQSYSPSSLDNCGSPKAHIISPVKNSRRNTFGIDFIVDEQSLNVYLKGFDANESIANISNPLEQGTNALSSFWSHPMTKTAKDVSAFLKRCQYQLSSTMSTASNSPISDDKGSPIGNQSVGMDTWRRLNVDSVALTQWNANLRMWISQTILNRLIKEFDIIDDALQKQGLLDIQVGKVGLERLRKTAQTALVLQFVPTLPAVLPFLELTANQEYLVTRIQQLAKGGCMSDFKWNSGSSYNGKEWDPTLPNDSAIIMHLFASYLDTQLMPSPNQPDTKPFIGYHYIKVNEKVPTLTSSTLAIQQVIEYPPHYRVIIGEEIYELVKGYNNLFHSILLFLYYVNKKEHGMLGRVNLGRSGVNMLWIIES